MASGSSAFEVGGRTVALPVRVHDGDQWSAQFLVRAGAAQALVDDPRLEVVQLLPRRAAASVSFARYRDNDLGPYDEVVIAFLVRYHDPAYGARRRKRLGRSRGETGIYVHGLATTAALAVEAGQTIWGYPRFLADIEIRDECGRVACSLAQEGRHVMRIELREGGPVS